ncbi:phospholipase D/nuclease [Clathrospora elynae]|uniref:Phospholipase D/nuclease n=1 Tax=Clathrospora elynae TaxID=706981 RepID=A0A6A5SJE6_9PLEO|nr:phospholipase D/nuclease [Clathrospora elynae]
MTPHDALPVHVEASLRNVNDVLLGIGGLGYTICYLLMARQSIRDRTYAMPLFSLAFNFGWEIVFALYVAVEVREQVIFTIWMLIDVGLVYTTVRYGANEWRHAPAVGRNIGKIFTGMLAWWCVALYAVSVWWLDVENPVNPKAGKAYKGVVGIDTNELGFWTALVAQVVLSVMSLAQIMVRGSSRGSSYSIWTTRFVGSLSGLNLNYGYCWWVWPEAHGYYTNPIVVLMMVTWVLADLGYLIVLCGRVARAQALATCIPLNIHPLVLVCKRAMSTSDDEDLKLAMAMSLQQIPPTASNEVIDLTSVSDDEDEHLRRAIALSQQESAKSDALQPDVATTTSTAAFFKGIDRKAMEQERLARLGKRKRDPSPEEPSKQAARSTLSKSSERPTLQYSKGAIKRTFATKYPRTDDITIDELLEASDVNVAVISSFMWDSNWLYKKLDPVKVKQVWLMNVKGGDVQKRYLQDMKESGVPNLKIHFPPLNGIVHCMHSKFMLLFGNKKLRIAVPTANMTPIDWGEVENNWQPGVMENSVFLIDLPRRGDGSVAKSEDLTPFGRELVYFLEQQKVEQKVIDGLLKFDFSQTVHLAFVHSMNLQLTHYSGGSHKTEPEHPTGLSGLTQAIRDLRLDSVKDIELDYAASSLGAINDTLLRRIYLAACGESSITNTPTPNLRNHIRIYFPTNETVEKSIGGPECGGIISLTKQYYNASTFPKECLRDYDSTRRGMLSHNKLLFARGRKKDGKPFAWVYVGSANISESAWGGQKVLKSGKMGSLNIRNWECGVVMPVSDGKLEHLKLGEGEVPPMAVFEGTAEVPYRFPGDKYGGKQPWFFRPG